MISNFDKVDVDIYRGGEPGYDDLNLLANVFDIKTILSLDGNVAAQIAPIVESFGMQHIVIPINGINSFNEMKYLQNNIVSLINSNKPIYIHCRHGSDRTGMAIALYRTQHDLWDYNEALREAISYGFGNGLDEDTERLYRDIIIKKARINYKSAGEDAVGAMRDTFDGGNIAPAFNSQQSWAPEIGQPLNEPIDDVPPAFRDPTAFSVKQQVPSKRNKRKRNLKAIIEELNAPQVGTYDNSYGIHGAGPLAGDDEGSGGFVYDTSGGLPGGVGPSNTIGFPNF
jgi:hypothetical protein